MRNILKPVTVLGDKAYIGLSEQGVLCPVKSNSLNKNNEKTFNDNLSKRRVKIEHLFARIKRIKSLYCSFWYNKSFINNKLKFRYKGTAIYMPTLCPIN